MAKEEQLARTISLDVVQRLNLEELLGQPVNPQARLNPEKARVLNRVRTKVKLSRADKRLLEERKVIVRVPSGYGVDEDLAEAEEEFSAFLETEEVFQLRRFFTELEHPNMVAILDWLQPLIDQLEAKIPAKPISVLEAAEKGA